MENTDTKAKTKAIAEKMIPLLNGLTRREMTQVWGHIDDLAREIPICFESPSESQEDN